MVSITIPVEVANRLRKADLEALVAKREVFPVATCYDATTAAWIFRGGIRVLVVGDSAAQLVLGLEPGQTAPVEFMAMITGAVRRGAPAAYVIGDLPKGAADADAEVVVAHARHLLREGADAVKLEVNEAHGAIVAALVAADVDVVAHLLHRPDGVGCTGQVTHAAALTPCATNRLVKVGKLMIDAGASMLLLDGIDEEASATILSALREISPLVPIFGCDAGKGCDGQVRMLRDLLGLAVCESEGSRLGSQIQAAAAQWVEQVRARGR